MGKISTAVVSALGLTCVLFLASCQKYHSVNQTLRYAGDNRHELEAVLDYFKNDEEKYEAAEFLIANMKPHNSYRGTEIYRYYELAEKLLASDLTPREQRDSLLHFCTDSLPNLNRRTISDAKVIKADFLIHCIDHAFNEWKNNPWSEHVVFDEFCEWILPYKAVELQELDYWQDTLCTYFSDGIKAMIPDDDEYATCIKVQETVRNEIETKIHPLGLYNQSGYPLLSASTLPHQTYGRCSDYVNLGVLTFRSLGIPVIKDGAPFWGRYRAGHEWYVILGDRGQELPAEWDITTVAGEHFFPYERIPKVYRETYSVNPERLKYKRRSRLKYDFSLCQTDVTEKYMRPFDIDIPINKKDIPGSRAHIVEPYAYIAIFNGHNTDWSIVDYGELENRIFGKVATAHFRKIGPNILYIVLGFNGRTLIPISKPFIVGKDGRVTYIQCDTSSLRDIDIKRKYYESANVVDKRRRILGAKIQCSDSPSFNNPVTVYSIDTTDIPDKIALDANMGAHRYWRYLGADGTCGSIAELAFFDSDTTLIDGGIPISCPIVSNDIVEKAFDGDWLSNFETDEDNPDGAWVGMDFGDRKSVSYVRIIPRSDDNDICPDNEYELKWWNDNTSEWVSLGVRTATDNVLHYRYIPSGALLWISDLTRGWDERPFLIDDDGKVTWL